MMEKANKLSPLKRTYLALEKMKSRLDALEEQKKEPIAIIGMGCRFPGGADDPDAFWRLLRRGGDAVSRAPRDRWDVDALYDPDPDAPGKMYTRNGGFLKRVDGFDPLFFGASPREAVHMDPQQRLLLEVSWEALENAGRIRDRLSNDNTGVFIGVTTNDYARIGAPTGRVSRIGPHHITGNTNNAAAGRISYTLGLRGPCLAVDAACASSLAAIHLACASLRAGECACALAGGVNLILLPDVTIALCKARVLSPDGRCKTFDASADGMGRGEGCGVLVLKRLSDAVKNRDNILALIRGSAVNHDGPSAGLTVPNGPAQESLIRRALENAGIAPDSVSCLEAHGTGTSLGDPIEMNALGAVFGKDRPGDRPLFTGSVKTNIGHLEAASGVAGVIKMVLSLVHREIPPHLHFKNPSPDIPWDRLPA
ncbi:MAG: polyketide synthase, partial [Desulfobacterales bacterium]|nr:polyketide synthase [Desulfobacterales bacterium]